MAKITKEEFAEEIYLIRNLVNYVDTCGSEFLEMEGSASNVDYNKQRILTSRFVEGLHSSVYKLAIKLAEV